jgi:hypothetical protein
MIQYQNMYYLPNGYATIPLDMRRVSLIYLSFLLSIRKFQMANSHIRKHANFFCSHILIGSLHYNMILITLPQTKDENSEESELHEDAGLQFYYLPV